MTNMRVFRLQQLDGGITGIAFFSLVSQKGFSELRSSCASPGKDSGNWSAPLQQPARFQKGEVLCCIRHQGFIGQTCSSASASKDSVSSGPSPESISKDSESWGPPLHEPARILKVDWKFMVRSKPIWCSWKSFASLLDTTLVGLVNEIVAAITVDLFVTV